MRAVVTGATGHLGSHLAAALSEQGHSVLAVVRPGSDPWRLQELAPGRIDLLHSEIREVKASQIAEFAPDVMFHLAWSGVTSDIRNSSTLALTNVENSLASFSVAAEAGCASWIGIGSQAEYGAYDRVLREDFPCDPSTLYGASKVAVRQLVQTLCHARGIRFVWFRLFATYGPMDDGRHLIPSVIDSFLRDQSPALTPGEQIWDYLFVRDAALALLEAGIRSDIEGVFNLASGVPLSVREIVEHIHAFIAPRCGTGLGAVPYADNQIMHLQADMTKWCSLSGWEPATGLTQGLHQTIEWHRARKAQNS